MDDDKIADSTDRTGDPASVAAPRSDKNAFGTDIYRENALAAASSRLGSPVKAVGVGAWALTGFLLALFICVALFLVVGRYTRKETVPGALQPAAGATRVTALLPWVVTEVRVTEGQIVNVGDPILIMSTDRSVAEGDRSSASLSDLIDAGSSREASAIIDQAEAKKEGAARSLEDTQARRTALEEDQVHLADSLSLQQERVRLAQETWQAAVSLHDRELFSTLQLRQREEALIAARQGVVEIGRQVRRNRASLQQLAAEEGRLFAEAAESAAAIRQAQAQFDQRQAQRLSDRAVVVTAARSGRIAALSVRAGMPVQPGRALAIILPEGARLQAEIWVPSRAAGFVQRGDQVRLMYDAFPYQKFGVGHGSVATVAGAPTDPADLTVPIEAKEALYRVVVDLDSDVVEGYGKSWRLVPGMRLSADLILDNRSLWEWLFDPIIAAQRRSKA